MAASARPLSGARGRVRDPDRGWKIGLGGIALLALAIFVGGAFLALLGFAGQAPDIPTLLGNSYFRGVVLFTLEQALLSTLLSVGGAIPLAVALHRVDFPGRTLVLRLMLLPQALPVLVGALAILAVWGRGGVVSDLFALAGLARLDLYGLTGILIAHVFFNLPLATRLMVSALDAVPAESWKLSGQLSLSPTAVFRIVEWPALRTILPGAASLVFMLCVTSFTLVLVLGGGPGATTIEVEIYQALHSDFDPGRAAVLALVQVALTVSVVATTMRFRAAAIGVFTLGRPARRFDAASTPARAVALFVIGIGTLFVATPFASVLVDGLASDLLRLVQEPGVWRAATTSLFIAIGAACTGVLLSACLLLGTEALRGEKDRRSRVLGGLFELPGGLILVVPPIVLGAGWFLALRQLADVSDLAPLMIVATNAVMAMPFIVRIVAPPLAASAERHDRLAESLGLRGRARLRHVEWPALRTPMGLAFAYALALSLGDLGVVAIFGHQDLVTLPLLLYQRMGSYRTADAAGLALILALLTLGLIAAAERGLGQGERAS